MAHHSLMVAILRGRGYLRGTQDLGNFVLKADSNGSGKPVLLKDVAQSSVRTSGAASPR